MLLWIFGLAKARAGKGYQNREREWRGSASRKQTPFRRLACVEISMGSPMLTSPGSTLYGQTSNFERLSLTS